MKYLLDTNACIFLMKNQIPIVEHYKKNKHLGVVISAITAAELFFGVYNSSNLEKNSTNLANFLIGLGVLKFDDSAAMEYGRIRAILKKQGKLIGQLDMLIAAHAKSRGLIVVTNNVKKFSRIAGLVLEDWTCL